MYGRKTRKLIGKVVEELKDQMYWRKTRKLIGKVVEELKDVEGVEFVAMLEKGGDHLVTASNTGVNVDELVAQTSIIYSTSERGGERLKKGAVEEIYVFWKEGTSILKMINKNYILLMIISKEAMNWVRPPMKATIDAILEILGS